MKRTYLDTSLAIEYSNAEGAERPDELFSKTKRTPEQQFLIDTLKSDRNFKLASLIRQKVTDGSSRLEFFISSLVWIEIQEWVAQEKLIGLVSEVSMFTQLKKEGRKRLGDVLKKIRYSASKESETCEYNDSAERLFNKTIVTSEELGLGGLCGIKKFDIENFTLDADSIQIASNLSYMQVGLADILHLFVAKDAGCTHFATLDSDFNRARELIKTSLDIEVLFREQVTAII